MSFVKKKKYVSSIDLNAIDAVEEAWSDEKVIKAFLSKDMQKFFLDLIGVLKKNNIDFNNKKIVDVGCGTGILLKLIKENSQGSRFSGIEFSENALKIVKRIIPEAEVSQFDIYNKFSKTFDIVLCTEVLEHLLYPEKAIKNLIDCLNAEGVLIITVPDGRNDTFEGHINFWSPESWQVFIENNCSNLEFQIDRTMNNHQIAIIKKNENN